MIERPTALILGAGSSRAYGFPLGLELLTHVLQGLRADSAHRTILGELGWDTASCLEFADSLAYSGCTSVDVFLENREEFLGIGKAAIAATLIPFENPESLFSGRARERGWYQYLFNLMRGPLAAFVQNQLRVITFNYDRSLESYLSTALKHSYGLTDDEVWAAMDKIRIIHVHGSLGELRPGAEKVRPYAMELDPANVGAAAERIVVVSESDSGGGRVLVCSCRAVGR